MDTLSRYEIWYGRDGPPPERVPLRAGSLTVEFEGGDLRYIRLGQQELVRRVYVAIRDRNWNTIPGNLADLMVEAASDSFTITFGVTHRAGPLHFEWRATITGASDGTVTYAMHGVAGSAFRYCRIGFCVLHPTRECAGRPYRAQTPAGPVTGELPLLIGPQMIENGFEAPLFPSFSSLAIALEDGPEVSFAFEGDLFEMEDQRNWTDGSFKTYCTPLALGYPHQAEEGQAFHQKVIIHAAPLPSLTAATAAFPLVDETARLTLGDPLGHGLPEIGLGMPSHPDSASGTYRDEDLTPREAALLSQTRPAHLKAELHLGDGRWPTRLDKAIGAARQIGTRLELALFLGDDAENAIAALKQRLAGVSLARLLVFHEKEASQAATSPRWVELVRWSFGEAFPSLVIGGGTNGNFAELHRAWPDVSGMDCLSFTINPQVHATDERSLIEALEAQESTIQTARAHCGGTSRSQSRDQVPICVSSVTLKPPFNQAAREAEEPPDTRFCESSVVSCPSELPSSVDPRQMSLFAAAWTVGSLRALTAAGAASVTYYETTGWRGLLETERGNPLPGRFRSTPGMVFPVYHVFADLGEAAGAEVIAALSSGPLRVQGLALREEGRWRVLAANLLPTTQRVTVGPLPAGRATVRRLNENTAHLAMFEPELFRGSCESWPLVGGEIVLALSPYETACLDIAVRPARGTYRPRGRGRVGKEAAR